jgi:hypothetical protein
MSDLIKTQQPKVPSQLVNQTAEPKQKQKQSLARQTAAPEIDLADELSEVAIAAADAPLLRHIRSMKIDSQQT